MFNLCTFKWVPAVKLSNGVHGEATVYVHQVVVQEFEPPTDPAQTQQSVPELTVLMKTQRLSHVGIKLVPVSSAYFTVLPFGCDSRKVFVFTYYT